MASVPSPLTVSSMDALGTQDVLDTSAVARQDVTPGSLPTIAGYKELLPLPPHLPIKACPMAITGEKEVLRARGLENAKLSK